MLLWPRIRYSMGGDESEKSNTGERETAENQVRSQVHSFEALRLSRGLDRIRFESEAIEG